MNKCRTKGFTLIELMITIAIVAVLATIAVPSLRDFLRNNRIAGAANDLLRAAQIARSEAITRRTTVVLCATADGATCSYGDFTRWIVFTDNNNNWNADVGETMISAPPALTTEITVHNDADGILSFNNTGFANAAGAKTPTDYIVICDSRGNETINANRSAARALVIEPTGRTRVSSKPAEVATAISATSACPS